MDKKYRKASFREGATIIPKEPAEAGKSSEGADTKTDVDPTNFKHPKIFMDVLTVYKIYYCKHEALPKIFRVTVGTEIMKEISSCLRLIVLANFKRVTKEDFAESLQAVKELRGPIELLKSYFLVRIIESLGELTTSKALEVTKDRGPPCEPDVEDNFDQRDPTW